MNYMSKIIKWGILGCGEIAHKFAQGLAVLPNAKLEAVASKTEGKAESLGKMFGVKNTYTDYIELVKDPIVDVIYIATTHNFHYENVLLCLNHGKAVLCEKPFTLNAIQAEELINTARKNKLFLMEAMWMRFIPCIKKLNEFLFEATGKNTKERKKEFGKVKS